MRGIMELPFDVMLNTDSPDSAESAKSDKSLVI